MEVPPHVGEVEYTTPARTPMYRRSKGSRGKAGSGATSPATPPAPSPSPSPTSPPVSNPLASLPIPRSLTTPDSALASLVSGDDLDDSTSTVVRDAVDNLLLNVIKQLQHDLLHGPAQTRSKIASQFLPRIMRLLDKEEAEDQTATEELRAEMERLNHELLHGEPVLYTPLSPHAPATGPAIPDGEDLPTVNSVGITVERDQQT